MASKPMYYAIPEGKLGTEHTLIRGSYHQLQVALRKYARPGTVYRLYSQDPSTKVLKHIETYHAYDNIYSEHSESKLKEQQ